MNLCLILIPLSGRRFAYFIILCSKDEETYSSAGWHSGFYHEHGGRVGVSSQDGGF